MNAVVFVGYNFDYGGDNSGSDDDDLFVRLDF